MDFIIKTVAPKGRRKYGDYITSKSTIKNVVTKAYSSNGGGQGGQGTTEETKETVPQYYLGLSRNSKTFDGLTVAASAQTDSVDVVAILDKEKGIACVGDISSSAETANYDISGLTTGITVSVSNNYSSAVTINITIANTITSTEGVLRIPLNVYLKKDSTLTSKEDFFIKRGYCANQIIEYQWNIPSTSDSNFRLDLSNESCGINCDKDYNILSGAIRPQCTASLYYGTTKVEQGVTFSISYPSSQNVQGVSINATTGVFTFNSGTSATPFNFEGTPLAITVIARYNGIEMPRGTMTITKAAAGQNGQNGQDGRDGVDGADGVDGQDGTSIVWKGTFSSHPSNPQDGWAYYNSTDKKSYTYRSGTWYQMTIDGINGTNGTDGKSIIWKGESQNPPANPQINWCYRDTDNGIIYIYNGTAWEVMTMDGDDGTDGTDGTDGLSVFITYHDNDAEHTPSKPTGAGTSGGWHTNPTNTAVWMSQKVAESSTGGTWGNPIRIKGTDGTDGEDAQTNWIELSTTAIVVDKETSGYTPSSVIATAYTQIGENQPFINTGLTIYYGYETKNPSNIYTTPISNIQIQYSTLNFCLKNNLGNPYELESVPILKNGVDGENGAQGEKGDKGDKGDNGLKGPSLRGPVDWYAQTTSRRFCNGAYDAQHPDDANWIDVIIKDNIYYYCNTSYNGSSHDSWSSVSSKWTASDQQFNFIATNLLLASAATINFLGSNQILVKDSDSSGSTVVAGVVGGQGVNFFAGAQTPNSAPFRVSYDGSILATKGKLSTIEINKLINPFVFSNQGIVDSGMCIEYDNVYNNEIGTGGAPVSITASYEHLDWTTNASGRRLTLCGSYYIEAPTGKYFYDNGATLNKLICFSEKIELVGIGDNSTFWGYVVVSRDNYRTAYPMGKKPNIQAQGSVVYSSGTFTLNDYIAPPLANYFVRQDTTATKNMDIVTSTAGTIRLVVPRAYAYSINDFYVNVTPYGKSSNSLPLICYVDKISTGTYYSNQVYFIDVKTFDKSSDTARGGIFFEIRNLRDFEMPPASWYKYYINLQSTKSIGNTASSGTIPIDSNYSGWTCTSNQSWLTVSKTNASTLSYSATANTGSSSRDAIITVSIPNVTKTCTVTQSSSPSGEYVFLAPSSMSIEATDTTFTIDVTSNYGSSYIPLSTSNVSITQSSPQMRTTVDSVSLVGEKYRFTFSCFESMTASSRTATITFTQPQSGLVVSTIVTQSGY